MSTKATAREDKEGLIVCIAGMHRSGTSMVARLFNLCGLHLGSQEKMVSAQPDNPRGFWENLDFTKLNDEILAQLGGAWDLPPSLVTDGWELRPAFVPLRNKAEELTQELLDHEAWGWKDPRNSLTLPFWKRLLASLVLTNFALFIEPGRVVAQYFQRSDSNDR